MGNIQATVNKKIIPISLKVSLYTIYSRQYGAVSLVNDPKRAINYDANYGWGITLRNVIWLGGTTALTVYKTLLYVLKEWQEVKRYRIISIFIIYFVGSYIKYILCIYEYINFTKYYTRILLNKTKIFFFFIFFINNLHCNFN